MYESGTKNKDNENLEARKSLTYANQTQESLNTCILTDLAIAVTIHNLK